MAKPRNHEYFCFEFFNLPFGERAFGLFCFGGIMGYRPDKEKGHRSQYEKNKKRIYATQTICGICGRPVDFSLKYPHPLSPTIDHILPVSKGGHPSDIDNLQLAHRCCNRRIHNGISVLRRSCRYIGKIN